MLVEKYIESKSLDSRELNIGSSQFWLWFFSLLVTTFATLDLCFSTE